MPSPDQHGAGPHQHAVGKAGHRHDQGPGRLGHACGEGWEGGRGSGGELRRHCAGLKGSMRPFRGVLGDVAARFRCKRVHAAVGLVRQAACHLLRVAGAPWNSKRFLPHRRRPSADHSTPAHPLPAWRQAAAQPAPSWWTLPGRLCSWRAEGWGWVRQWRRARPHRAATAAAAPPALLLCSPAGWAAGRGCRAWTWLLGGPAGGGALREGGEGAGRWAGQQQQ